MVKNKKRWKENYDGKSFYASDHIKLSRKITRYIFFKKLLGWIK
jgi:hypothetical protein